MNTTVRLEFSVTKNENDYVLNIDVPVDTKMFKDYSNYETFIDCFQRVKEVQLSHEGYKVLSVTEQFNSEVHNLYERSQQGV